VSGMRDRARQGMLFYVFTLFQTGCRHIAQAGLELLGSRTPDLGTQEAEIRRIMVPSQPRQIVHESHS
jgi:hypothetical protein